MVFELGSRTQTLMSILGQICLICGLLGSLFSHPGEHNFLTVMNFFIVGENDVVHFSRMQMVRNPALFEAPLLLVHHFVALFFERGVWNAQQERLEIFLVIQSVLVLLYIASFVLDLRIQFFEFFIFSLFSLQFLLFLLLFGLALRVIFLNKFHEVLSVGL